MIELIAVLRIAANISSAAAWREFWMISNVMGSLVCMVMVPSIRSEIRPRHSRPRCRSIASVRREPMVSIRRGTGIYLH